MSESTFPVSRAVRHFLDAVSYSNPVPHWHDYRDVRYRNLEEQLHRRVQAYLADENRPSAPFQILIPDRASAPRRWLVPSVFDQIVLEAAVTELAKDIAPADRERVYSYRYQEQEDELSFYEDLFGAWGDFQTDTFLRVDDSDEFVVRLDLRQAFARFDRAEVLDFVTQRATKPDAASLFNRMINWLDPDGAGLPNMNDSLFYVGNAFLVHADQAVNEVTPQFIRYMDNYHVFARSDIEAAELANDIGAALARAGFELNAEKTQILDPATYSMAISDLRGGIEDDITYLSAPIGGTVDPDRLALYVYTAVLYPEEYLTKSFGRLVLGGVRRSRAAGGDDHANYLEVLQTIKFDEQVRFRERALALLPQLWSAGADQEWRVLWLLYMLEDLKTQPSVKRVLDELATRKGTESGELWLRQLASRPHRRRVTDSIHSRGYLEEGRALNAG